MSLITCMIRADANLLLSGSVDALKAARETKIDAPLRGVEEKLKAERNSWKGDEASFAAKHAMLINHRDTLSLYADRANEKLQPKPVVPPEDSAFSVFAKKAGTAAGGLWSKLQTSAAKLTSPSKFDYAVMGVAATTLVGALNFSAIDDFLTKSFNRMAAQSPAPAATVDIVQKKIEPTVIVSAKNPRKPDASPSRSVTPSSAAPVEK